MRLVALALLIPAISVASDALSILDFAAPGTKVDRTGVTDASQALANAISAANAKTAKGEPACVYVPAGVYRIVTPPPMFSRAGCIKGAGPTQSTIVLDREFEGDLFTWSEAWIPTTPGPTVVGLRIRGSESASKLQNALVFYDRNDEVFLDTLDIIDVHGRALYSGATKNTTQAYMRESFMRSLRFFGDGAPGVPVVEFNSQGTGSVDATNEIRMSQVEIYGPRGPGFTIRNNGTGVIRGITVDGLRIEGTEHGTTRADLLDIGDDTMTGEVNNITLTGMELVDPYKGFAALRISAPPSTPAPYQIMVSGMIGGGLPYGQGLRIDAGRTSTFRFTGIHTFDTNVVIGPGVSQIVLDGGGLESSWTYKIDPTSRNGISVPVRAVGDPSAPR